MAKREDERTLIVDFVGWVINLRGSGVGSFDLIVSQVPFANHVERFGTELFAQFSIDEERHGLVITGDGEGDFFALLHAIVEGVEIAVTFKTEQTVARVGKIEDSVGRAEEFRTFCFFFAVDFEGDGVVIANFLCVQCFAAFDLIATQDDCSGFAEASLFVHAGGFAQREAASVVVCVRQRSVFAAPAFDGERLQSREDAVVDVFDGNAIAGVVVPNGKHTSLDGGVVFFKLLTADDGGSPRVVEVFGVEIVVVVTCGGHDIDISVGNADELIALLFHVGGVGKAVVPDVHEHVF